MLSLKMLGAFQLRTSIDYDNRRISRRASFCNQSTIAPIPLKVDYIDFSELTGHTNFHATR